MLSHTENTPLTLSVPFSRAAMTLFLRFCYCGIGPGAADSQSEIDELTELTSYYSGGPAQFLKTYLENAKEGLSEFNESFKTFIPDEAGKNLAKLAPR